MYVLTSPTDERIDIEFCTHPSDMVKVTMFGDYLLHGDNAQKRMNEVGYVRAMFEARAVVKTYVRVNGNTFEKLTNNFRRGMQGSHFRLDRDTKKITLASISEEIDPHGLIFDLRLNIKKVHLP